MAMFDTNPSWVYVNLGYRGLGGRHMTKTDVVEVLGKTL